jgi:hypothetical protein
VLAERTGKDRRTANYREGKINRRERNCEIEEKLRIGKRNRK